MVVAAPEPIASALTKLAEAANGLTAEVYTDRQRRDKQAIIDRQQRRREQRRMTVILALVAALVIVLTALSISNRQLGNGNRRLNQQNARLNAQNAEIVARISDCTNTGGKCYQESQQRAAEYFSGQLKGQIAAQVCGKSFDTAAAIERCVKRALAPSVPPPPTPAQKRAG